MAITIWLLSLGAAGLLAVPTAIFAFECIAGALPRKRQAKIGYDDRSAIAILVPAHDEELGIADTVKSIQAQMQPEDRLLVVADNCSDHTATVARNAGAEVIERTDTTQRGKGYALDFGIAHLACEPPAVVVFVDADCTLVSGTLDTLAHMASSTGRPAQASNLMVTRHDQKHAFAISEFAFMVKNHVRARGLAFLGLPCQLTGTGMALPWRLASSARLASDEIVEDMKLGLDLAAEGHFPVYCEEAGVRSYFPESTASAQTQHRRWETGHLRMLSSGLRRLADWRHLSIPYAVMTLDVMVPPLVLLLFMISGATIISAAVASSGIGSLPLLICIALLVLLVAAIVIAWIAHGRSIIPVGSLMRLPHYAAGKIALYLEMLFSRSPKSVWVRTGRGPAPGRPKVNR